MLRVQLTSPKQRIKETLIRIWDRVYEQCTFFRLHVTAFVLIPLVFSGIFYASNGQFKVAYIDALFLCYSAMTGTGLVTLNLSTLTPFQQVLLWFLMAFGTQTTVSWLMVLTRRYYIRTKCTYVYWQRRPRTREELFQATISSPRNARGPDQNQEKSLIPNIDFTRPTPQPTPQPSRKVTAVDEKSPDVQKPFFADDVVTSSPTRLNTIDLPAASFDDPGNSGNDATSPLSLSASIRRRRILSFEDQSRRLPSARDMSIMSTQKGPYSTHIPGVKDKYQGLGGFPSILRLLKQLTKRYAPMAYHKLERSMTLPTTSTLEISGSNITAGRNSNFHTDTLTDDQLEDIGGVEYRAVNLLCYLIPFYFVLVQLIAFLIFTPWLLVTRKYNHVLTAQPRIVSKSWFSLFLVMSAYSGTGLDLCDTAMLPFQEAYLMIFAIMFTLLAGNHAQPVFLRLIIWVAHRFATEGSETYQTLKFLLDHPRRCYLYLFPSAQTWFLFIVLCCLSAIEWAAFGILNLGLPVLSGLPIAPRVIIGLFQGIAVRASGLTIIAIGNLAPALQFLYIVLMYIAVYPVGMCIRATNVYEEQSLGIFEPPEGDLKENLEELDIRERVGRYLGWHLRQQMAIDIWWLVWGIFVVTIVERGNIMNPDKPYIAIFPIIFEFVSAFAGIGLSLGFPTDNYSLVGSMRTLSKIAIIVVMIRGRHRGLPVAVDRAVLLPSELVTNRLPSNHTGEGRTNNIAHRPTI